MRSSICKICYTGGNKTVCTQVLTNATNNVIRNLKGCYARAGKEIPYFLQREEMSLNQAEFLICLPAMSFLFIGLGTKIIRRIKPASPIKGVTYRDRSNSDSTRTIRRS